MQILIFFFLLHMMTTASSGVSPPYIPENYILHNCGAPSEKYFQGRKWEIDDNYPECLEPNATDISVTTTYRAVADSPSSSHHVPEVPYRTVHIFPNQCTRSYPVSPGLVFIRLHFNPSRYRFTGGFSLQPEDSFFSVTANEHTLLANFSAYLSAHPSSTVVEKEYVVHVNTNRLNITFTPSSSNSYAFVNGIEIVSIPTNYYIRGKDDNDNQIKFVNTSSYYYLFNNTALETLYRLNVGGKMISAVEDTGMDRTWYSDDQYVIDFGYFTPFLNVNITYTPLSPPYSAPEILFTSARTIGNYSNVVNWTFPVDSGFLYLFRLYFCEFAIEIDGANERVFSVDIANITAERHVDVYLMAGGSKTPIFRDYVVNVPAMDGRLSKQNVSFAIRPNMETRPVWANALLNGLEIFKLNDTHGSMAASNPERLQVSVNQAPSSKNTRRILVEAIVGSVVGGVAVVAIMVFLVNFRRKRLSPRNLSRSSSSKTNDSVSAQSTELCRLFSLEELKSATADFDDSYVIGKGGFGKVYRAYINSTSIDQDGANNNNNNNIVVAVKRLNKAESRQGEKEFWMEINMLSNLRNQHLVSLIGYCNQEQEMLIVYEYMARGTLADHLYNIIIDDDDDDDDNPCLSWEQRLNICLHSARGLRYLHAKKVIHRDVKSSNILLDQTLMAKISDFGLSKTGQGNDSFTHLTTDVKGTFGYLDPEYFLTRRLTTKSDVFAFGVVLFEVLSGRPALDMRLVEEQHSLATWAVECIRKGEIDQIFDRCLVGQISPPCSKVFVEIAGRCLLRDPSERPDMADVVKNLELALGMQQKSELALNVSGNCSDINPTSKGWSYLVRSHLYKLCQRGKILVSKQ